MTLKFPTHLSPSLRRPHSRSYVTYTLTAIARCCRMVKKATGEDLWKTDKVKGAFSRYVPYVNGKKSWPHSDSQKDFEWKWASEFTRLAARAYESSSYEEAAHGTKGSHLRLYGSPTAAVFSHLDDC